MNSALSPSQVSGGFAIAATGVPGTVVARVPKHAETPAVLTVKNRDSAALMYLKWIPISNTGQVFDPNDAGIVLLPTQSKTWSPPPRGVMLIVNSSVANAILAVDGSWTVPEEAQLL